MPQRPTITALALYAQKQKWIPDQVRNDGEMDSGFSAWMHLISWERMNARNDRARNYNKHLS